MSKFNIQNKAEEFMSYALHVLDESPKKLRGDIVPEMRKLTIDVLLDVVYANFHFDDKDVRLGYQIDARKKMRGLNALAEACMVQNYITKHQYEVLTGHTFELDGMIGNWIESDAKRASKV